MQSDTGTTGAEGSCSATSTEFNVSHGVVWLNMGKTFLAYSTLQTFLCFYVYIVIQYAMFGNGTCSGLWQFDQTRTDNHYTYLPKSPVSATTTVTSLSWSNTLAILALFGDWLSHFLIFSLIYRSSETTPLRRRIAREYRHDVTQIDARMRRVCPKVKIVGSRVTKNTTYIFWCFFWKDNLDYFLFSKYKNERV